MIKVFLEKDPLRAHFQKNVSESIHRLSETRFVCKFRENWLTGNRQGRALFTWQKTKLSQLHKVSRSRFCADRAQNQPGPAPNNILGAPKKCHSNPFTSGRVIAVRVNVVETRHKVFPIVGEVSSPSNKIGLSHLSHVHLIWISALQSAVFWPKYIYVVPVYHLNRGIEEPINIINY